MTILVGFRMLDKDRMTLGGLEMRYVCRHTVSIDESQHTKFEIRNSKCETARFDKVLVVPSHFLELKRYLIFV